MLTKTNILAMKRADSICFRTQNGISTIECIKEKDDTNPYGSSYTFKVEVQHKSIRGNDKSNPTCFYHSAIYKWDFCPIRSMISSLKPDDIIKLVWYKDTDILENNYISDSLYIEIIRKDKIKYNLLITTQTGRDNRFRMIK